MPIETLRDLFEYELEGMYYVENELVDRLSVMADEVTSDEIRKGFADHERETEEHVQRLERVFDEMGIEPAMREDAALDGLLEQKHRFDDEVRDDELRNLYYVGAGIKTEKMEVTAYDSLVRTARQLDLSDDVTDLLEQNRDEDEKAAGELETMAGGSTIKDLLSRLAPGS